MNSTLDGARKDIEILKSILENLGFLINMEKSIFVPVQIIEFLGIIVDSTNMRFLLPDEKVAVIQKECRQLVSSQVTSLSQLSNIIGKLTYCKTAVLQAPLHYRGIQHLKNSNMFPHVVNNLNIPLDPHALEDLRWWVDNLYLANGCPIQDSLPHLMIQSDASNSGWGSSEQWGKHLGNMDKRGIQSSYQLQRATSSIISSESIHQGAAKCPCIDSNRQYNNHFLYQQDGGCQKVSPRSLCKTPLGSLSTKTNYSEGRTHPGSPQHNSRQGVMSQTRFFRLAPEPTILSDTNEGSGTMYD